MAEQEAILEALRGVVDPDLERDVVSTALVRDLTVSDGKVSFKLQSVRAAGAEADALLEKAKQAAGSVAGVSEVEASLTAAARLSPTGEKGGIPGVANIIAVASGKGGVGKSTVSTNLAVALRQTGARVGILDADVYGPSIPTILGATQAPQQGGKGIIPVVQHGVRMISTGFFIRQDQAVVWRGPMLAKMVDQLINQVEWGELDYLIIDLPPGTGDVQLTLCQRVALTGALIVTTPQLVAVQVAEKAIIMFNQLKTPLLGVVENMSYYESRTTGEREFIFGSGGAEKVAEHWKIPLLGKIPLATTVREHSDAGNPIVLADPEAPAAKAFRHVAMGLIAETAIRNQQAEVEGLVEINF